MSSQPSKKSAPVGIETVDPITVELCRLLLTSIANSGHSISRIQIRLDAWTAIRQCRDVSPLLRVALNVDGPQAQGTFCDVPILVTKNMRAPIEFL